MDLSDLFCLRKLDEARGPVVGSRRRNLIPYTMMRPAIRSVKNVAIASRNK